MALRAIRIALLISILPLAGCGTVANLARQKPGEGGVAPFGGVRQDVACIHKAANGEVVFRTHAHSDSEQYPQRALILFCAVDLPFSLLGDIVTWPYTVTYSFINQPTPIPPVTLTDPQVPQAPPTPPEMPQMPIPTPPVTQATGISQLKVSP